MSTDLDEKAKTFHTRRKAEKKETPFQITAVIIRTLKNWRTKPHQETE